MENISFLQWLSSLSWEQLAIMSVGLVVTCGGAYLVKRYADEKTLEILSKIVAILIPLITKKEDEITGAKMGGLRMTEVLVEAEKILESEPELLKVAKKKGLRKIAEYIFTVVKLLVFKKI